MLKQLLHHKGYANAELLKAIRLHPDAANDPELKTLLHHIILANRFWMALILGLPFALEEESQVPDSFEAIAARYRETYERETEWMSRMSEGELDRRVETQFIPGQTFSISEALMQVSLHSHGHRAQCATRLRLLGGEPPNMDFILWLKDQPKPDWEVS